MLKILSYFTELKRCQQQLQPKATSRKRKRKQKPKATSRKSRKRKRKQKPKATSRKRKLKQKPKATSRKWKRKQKVVWKRMNDEISTNEQTDINELPNEILVNILSRISLKEAARTSVLARRWRYIWRSVFGTLQFDSSDVLTADGGVTQVRNFDSWVNNVLELHQGRYIEGMVVIFEGMNGEQRDMMCRKTSGEIDSWVCFAVRKEVQRLELCLSITHDSYEFPSIEVLRSHCTSPFRLLRSLRLVYVPIEDEMVRYLLGSCANLEELCIWGSVATKELRVVDPPSLRFLEIKRCNYLTILEISCESLFSLAYVGDKKGDLRKVPNLRELTIGEDSYLHFISEPDCSSYSDQLVKLVVDLHMPISCRPLACFPDWLPQFMSLKRLELQVGSLIGRSLLFFTWMIKASPQLCELRIEMNYELSQVDEHFVPFPAISGEAAVKFDHRNLIVVEMCGYIGCLSEKELLLELLKNASSIKTVFIDTESDFYDGRSLATYIKYNGEIPFSYEHEVLGATTRAESISRAEYLSSTLPRHIKFSVN